MADCSLAAGSYCGAPSVDTASPCLSPVHAALVLAAVNAVSIILAAHNLLEFFFGKLSHNFCLALFNLLTI